MLVLSEPQMPQAITHSLFIIKNSSLKLLIGSLISLVLGGCSTSGEVHASKLTIDEKGFGVSSKGENIKLYTLRNSNGMTVKISTFGGVITSLQTPDKYHKLGEVILGYDSWQEYVNDQAYTGPLIGRFGNRIARGAFSIKNKTYQLEINNGLNHLHGGSTGFHKANWKASQIKGPSFVGLKLTHTSPDNEGGYPGTLVTTAIYKLNDKNELSLTFEASTDAPTPVNMTQHTYFNLAGGDSVLNHKLTIYADEFLPVDETLIPLGPKKSVAGTPFDFREGKKIGTDIDQVDTQLQYGQGYDHNWVVSSKKLDEVRIAARLEDPVSGRVMEIFSDQPGLQFYSGNFMDGSLVGKQGKRIEYRNGIALEPQHFPDSPNQPIYPSTILMPGEKYSNTIVYKFSISK